MAKAPINCNLHSMWHAMAICQPPQGPGPSKVATLHRDERQHNRRRLYNTAQKPTKHIATGTVPVL